MSAPFWVVAALVLLTLELLGPALVFCWFAAGAVFVALAAALGVGSLVAQLLLFAGSSTALVVASRTVFRGLLPSGRRRGRLLTGAAALPGQLATTLTPVDAHGGQVRLHGMEWSARALDENRPIPAGRAVRVIQVEGVKLIVDPEEEMP
jgi:membrane protein implicated in regulation of membrane protease activity